MQSSTKEHAEGPFHKLKSSFREIFGKSSDAPTLKTEGAGEKKAGNDYEKNSSL